MHPNHLDGAIATSRDDVVCVRQEDDHVNEGGVASKLLQCLAGLQAVDPGEEEGGSQTFSTLHTQVQRSGAQPSVTHKSLLYACIP